MNKIIITAIFALTAMFALGATAQEVSLFAGTGYGGTEAKFSVGNHDAAEMANHHDMTVKSLKVSKYLRAILYKGGVVEGDFKIPELVHGGGDNRQPVVTGLTLPDGNILRFEFLTDSEVSAYFWEKGTEAGQKKHRTPHARAILRMEKLTPKGAATEGEEALATTVPAGAATADITKPGAEISGAGKWEYGFSTKAKPSFNEFMNDDNRFSEQGVSMKNQTNGSWFSIAQNKNSKAIKINNIHYPAYTTGEMVLVPGAAEGDETKVRFEANQNATYSFSISAQLIEEQGTQEIYGAGVTIYGSDNEELYNKHLVEHKVPWGKSFDLKLNKGQFVTIAVDYGNETNKTDHVAVTSSAWIKKP